MKKGALLVLFPLLLVNLQGQDILYRDSLRTIMDTAVNDTTKIRALRFLAIDIAMHSPDSMSRSLALISEAIALAGEKKVRVEQMDAHNDRAWMHYLQGDLQNAKTDYQSAIKIAEETDDEWGYHTYRDKLTTILFEEGKKDEALEMKYASLDYFERTRDTLELLKSLGLLGHAYSLYREFDKWKEVLHKQLSYEYDTPGNIETHGNLGIVHYELGNLDSAVYYIQKADTMGRAYPFFTIANRMYLAKVYHKKGDLPEAVHILEGLNNDYADLEEKNLYEVKMLLAEYYLEAGDADRAARFFTEAEDGLLSQDLVTQQKRGLLGYRIQRRKGDYEEALRYYQAYHAASDSLNQVSRDSAYRVIESKYQLVSKEEEILAQKLQLRNLWLGLFALGTVVSLGLLGFYFWHRKQKYEAGLLDEKAKTQALEIESLRKENRLISMQAILEGQEEERKRIARDLHDNIGSMITAVKLKLLSIRNNSEQLDGMLSQISDEVRRISHNMTPLAFGLSGLTGAVEDLCRQVSAQNIEVINQTEDLDMIREDDRAIRMRSLPDRMAPPP